MSRSLKRLYGGMLFSDEALRSTHFTWGKPIPPTESTVEDDEELDDAELNLDKVEEEMAADYSEEEEEEILHIDALHVRQKKGHYYWPFLSHRLFRKCFDKDSCMMGNSGHVLLKARKYA